MRRLFLFLPLFLVGCEFEVTQRIEAWAVVRQVKLVHSDCTLKGIKLYECKVYVQRPTGELDEGHIFCREFGCFY